MSAIDIISTDILVASSVNVSGKLADSPFSIDWLLKALHAADDKFNALIQNSKVENITAVDISQGKGYVSKVYKVSIEFDNLEKPYEVILKVPGTESLNEDPANQAGHEMVTDDFVATCHNRECHFYNDYAAHIDVPLPKVYKAVEMVVGKSAGALLMESLVGTAESCHIWQSGTKQQAFNAAKHLATMYKYFLCLPKEQWTGKFLQNSLASFPCDGDIYLHFFDETAEMAPGVFDEAMTTFREYFCSKPFYMYLMTNVYKDIGLPPVLTHGDLWSNNMMWKKNADGSISNEISAIIDWQIIHEGCMTTDIARFMTFCLDGDVRRECEYDVLRYMYERIVELMKEDGKSVDFTYEQMKKGYQANMIAQSVLMLMIPSFMFIGDQWTPEERPIKSAQRDKMLLRIQFALEDAMKYFKDIPKHRLS